MYSVGPCYNGIDVSCILQDEQPQQRRMNVRMQAAFILACCLVVKAAYMIVLNYVARGSTKDHCLTLGDVLVASVLEPELKIKNECLLNSGDGYLNDVAHVCHKHCEDTETSPPGDPVGHCQKCKKFNEINKAANLPHPTIAIKHKRSLLSNLGSSAITQMLILTITSFAMLSVSMILVNGILKTIRTFPSVCTNDPDGRIIAGQGAFLGPDEGYGIAYSVVSPSCEAGVGAYLKQKYGTWGGFSSSGALTSLPPDRLGSEFMAFAISNGAQFIFSLLYLLLIYNLSLISMEQEWGAWETKKKRPRCTIVSGRPFKQTYFLQLPFRLLLPLMGYAAVMHWLLGQAISTIETIYTDPENGIEHSLYTVRINLHASKTILNPPHCRRSLLPCTQSLFPLSLSSL